MLGVVGVDIVEGEHKYIDSEHFALSELFLCACVPERLFDE